MKKSQRNLEVELKNAHKLRENLKASKIKLKNKADHRLPTDLFDLHTICVECIILIEELTKEENWLDNSKLRRIISDLESQLFTHLNYHYKPLKKTLDKIYWQITTEKDVENDLRETLKAANQIIGKSKKEQDIKNVSLESKNTSKTKNKTIKKKKSSTQ